MTKQSDTKQPDDANINVTQSLPTVSATAIGDMINSSSLSIRGFGDDAINNTALVVDGVNQMNADNTLPMLEQWPWFNIKTVQANTQTNVAHDGDRAIGGAITIETKPIRDRPNIIDIKLGNHNTQRLAMQLKTTNGPWSAVALVNTNNTDNDRDHNAQSSTLFNTGIAWDGERQHWQWTITALQQSLQLPGALTESQVNTDPHQAQNTTDWMDTRDTHTNLSMNSQVGDDWHYRSTLFYSDINHSGWEISSYNNDDHQWKWHQQFTSDHTHWLNSQWDATSDLTRGDYHYQSDTYNTASTQQIASAALQSVTPLWQRTRVILGLRTTNNDQQAANQTNAWSNNQTALANTQALEYRWGDNNTVKVQRATSYRFPTTDEIAWTQNNQPLNTQTGTTYDISTNIITDKTNLTLQGYDLLLNNEILYAPFNDSLYFGYNENLPPTSRLGAMLSLKQGITRSTYLTVFYSIERATIDEGSNKGNAIPFVPAVNWQATLKQNIFTHWTASVNYRYIGSRYPLGDTSNIGIKSPGVGLVNMALRYQRHAWATTLSINNLLNQQYDEASILTVDTQGNPNTVYYPAAGIQVLFSGHYLFD